MVTGQRCFHIAKNRPDAYDGEMLKMFLFLLALTTAAFAQDLAKDEAQIWNLEKAYWESACVIHATLGYSGDRVAG